MPRHPTNRNLPLATLAVSTLLASCGGDGSADGGPCDAEPEVRTTSEGVEYVRTPDACFQDLPDWPYAPQYVEIDGLRQAYVDEGPRDGEVVLLLHGQPSWSYLYRKMIPVLTEAGYRAIAMDHLGLGRSDKPTEVSYYSYLRHSDRLERFIEALDLRDITLFAQDWGSLIGLRVAGLNTERFARIAVGNGDLPVIPAGVQFIPEIEDPDVVDDDLQYFLTDLPAQQPSFYDGCTLNPLAIAEALGADASALGSGDPGEGFFVWANYAMKSSRFRPSEILEALTWFDLPDAEEAAYDAPYPSRIYMTGPRTFPSLASQLGGVNDEAGAGLASFTGPFITIWGGNDPGNLGQCDTQRGLICGVPGAEGQAHTRLPEASHFLQDDQGGEIAARMVAWMGGESTYSADFTPDCTEEPTLPITEAGTGTPCADDTQCSGLEASSCISTGGMGFCSIEGCAAGGCGMGYACCRECNPAAAAALPFEGSACFPEAGTAVLTGMAGCTCD
jgi:pimeloyl-ACP methyl ester carboxylesterase